MGIQVLFLLTFLGIVLGAFWFLQWMGGQKPKPNIVSARDVEEAEEAEAARVKETSKASSDNDRPNSE